MHFQVIGHLKFDTGIQINLFLQHTKDSHHKKLIMLEYSSSIDDYLKSRFSCLFLLMDLGNGTMYNFQFYSVDSYMPDTILVTCDLTLCLLWVVTWTSIDLGENHYVGSTPDYIGIIGK